MSSKIMELLKNKTEDVADNINDKRLSKGLMRLAEALNAEDVHDALEDLSLGDFYKLKASAGNMLNIPHKRYVYEVRGGSLSNLSNLELGHLRDIHSPKAHHHELTDLVLEDKMQGGSLWGTLGKVAKHALLAKPIYDAGKYAVNNIKPVVKYMTSREGLDAINTGLRIAELAKSK